jgi:putative acetyltransferase
MDRAKGPQDMHTIRSEELQDITGIRRVNLAAFEAAAEADLVDALRQHARPFLSLVAVETDGAEEADEVVGHIAFSPVTLLSYPDLSIAGLAPMAVMPSRQRQGIGSSLVEAGLLESRRLGFDAVVVLGHARYYPRFGFLTASNFGLVSEYDVPDDVFMALELRPGALRGHSGTIRYHSAFSAV